MKETLKIPAPAIVIVLLLVAFFAADRWLLPGPKAPPTDAPKTAETPSAPDVEPVAADVRPEFDFVKPAGPVVTPMASSWSTFHGGPNLSGMTDVEIPDAPEVLWRFQTQGTIYYTPVADEAGIFIHTLRGRIYGLDFDGNERWSRHLIRRVKDDGTEVGERLDAPIAVFLSTVFVSTLDGTIYALDSATGETRWTYEVDGPILGTVNMYVPDDDPEASRLFVIGQNDGALHAVDPRTGAGLWSADSIDRCDGSATVGDGTVVYGSCAAAFHVFSADDGSLIKNIELDVDSQVAAAAAVAGDSIFGGSHSGRFFHASIREGGIVWMNEDAEDEIFTTPALSEELVIFASYDGNLYALDRATGIGRWTFKSDGYPTSAVIASDKVVFGIDGVLYILGLDDGKERWSYEISDEIASPAIINGMIVVGSEDGTVTAFGKG